MLLAPHNDIAFSDAAERRPLKRLVEPRRVPAEDELMIGRLAATG
jgi:hypothetical protein